MYYKLIILVNILFSFSLIYFVVNLNRFVNTCITSFVNLSTLNQISQNKQKGGSRFKITPYTHV